MPREGKYAPSTLLRPATSEALCRENSSSDSVARPAGFQNAASPRPAMAVAVCPIPTACAPTGNTRKSAPALRGSSWADRRMVGWADSRTVATSSHPPIRPSVNPSEPFRLIDQHDGNVVFDGIDQTAGVTGERLRIGAMLERSFALRADENLEQVGREAHEVTYPSRLRDGSSRRHLGSTFTCRSRKTRWPSSASILARAAAPRALMVRPPSPMTIPFWLSRSTYSTARIYTGSTPS